MGLSGENRNFSPKTGLPLFTPPPIPYLPRFGKGFLLWSCISECGENPEVPVARPEWSPVFRQRGDPDRLPLRSGRLDFGLSEWSFSGSDNERAIWVIQSWVAAGFSDS
ncbi:MAG: hypothetical protein CMJ92_01350 [Planctomycetes bacterium]|nr:hypothetical protein [Planctomycetota bacterium]